MPTPHTAHRPLHRPLHDEPAGDVQVRPLNSVKHLVERHATRRHAVRIHLHLELSEIATQALDRCHARHGQQPVANLELSKVAQRHEVYRARLGFQRELENLIQATGEARQQRGLGSGRQLGCRLRDSLRDELARAVVVGIGLELDRDL